jgi:hypothetical protein
MKSKRATFWRKFGRIVGHILLFCLFSAAVWWLGIWAFTIKNIVVIGTNIQVQVDETRLPKTLLLFPAAKLRAQLLTDNPILADLQFQKKYPHTLIIVPTLRTAIVRLQITGRQVLLDESGIVLMDADSSSVSLPCIFVPLPVVQIGRKIDDRRVTAGIDFITGMRQIVPIQMINIEDGSSLRAKSDTLTIVFPQDGDMGATLATLQTLLAGFRIKGTLPTFIDLRFDKPLVKF